MDCVEVLYIADVTSTRQISSMVPPAASTAAEIFRLGGFGLDVADPAIDPWLARGHSGNEDQRLGPPTDNLREMAAWLPNRCYCCCFGMANIAPL
jgi:hypothetical protein